MASCRIASLLRKGVSPGARTIATLAFADRPGRRRQLTTRSAVTGFTVRETPCDGIHGDAVDDIVYEDVAVEWATPISLDNGTYGSVRSAARAW